ncbi:MAG TPA: hypothetical protein VMU22_03110 [Rhizomicrobium sp.]|nr:hypothetical protein [Rhizomicrobium sp.]
MTLPRLLLALSLLLPVAACGTKAPLEMPQCSKEERAENSVPAPANVSRVCGKLSKGQRNPSEPPNPIAR